MCDEKNADVTTDDGVGRRKVTSVLLGDTKIRFCSVIVSLSLRRKSIPRQYIFFAAIVNKC